MVWRTAPFVACMLCFAGPQLTVAAEAEDRHPMLESPFSIDIGVFYPDRELDLRVNGTVSGINDEIDFDKRRRVQGGGDIFATELSWRFPAGGRSLVSTSKPKTELVQCSKRTSNGATSFSVRAAMLQ